MKTLDGQSIFAYMTNVDDKYVEESAYMASIPSVSQPVSIAKRLGDFFNHPLGVACICAVVAISVLAGIVLAGRRPSVGPSGVGTGIQTETEQIESNTSPLLEDETAGFFDEQVGPFSFRHDLEPSIYLPTQKVTLLAYVVNRGDAFAYRDYQDTYYPQAVLVHSQDQSQIQPSRAPKVNGSSLNTYEVSRLQEGRVAYVFTIPSGATAGNYHLVLTYADQSQTFENVITVLKNTDSTEGKLTEIQLGGQTIALTYQTTTQDTPALDTYLGDDGVLYSFHANTNKLYDMDNYDIRSGSYEGGTNITAEEARAVADATLRGYGRIGDVSCYKVSESGSTKNGFFIEYEYYIGDTHAWYTVNIGVNRHGHVFVFHSNYWGENLPYITQADIDAAVVRFYEKYPQLSSHYIHIEDDMLCVVCEVIEPAPSVTDEMGNEYPDHIHVFYTEIITPLGRDETS